MTEATLNTLMRRLDRLERHNRQLRLVVAVTLVGLATLGVMGQAGPRDASKVLEATQVQAQRFMLQDANRRVLGGMYVTDDGTPSFVLSQGGQNSGQAGFLIGVKDGIMSLNLYSKGGQLALAPNKLHMTHEQTSRLSLLSDVNGGPTLVLYDSQGRQRIWLLAPPDGPPLLKFLNADGTTLRIAP